MGLTSAPVLAEDGPAFELNLEQREDAFMVEGSYQLNDSFSLRLPMGIATPGAEFDSGDDQISVGGLGVIADYDFGVPGLRLSGGAIAPGGGPDGDGQVGYLVDGMYVPLGRTSFTTSSSSLSPILSFGYERDFDSGWSMSGDLGAIFDMSEDNLSVPSAQGTQVDMVPFLRLGLSFRF
ncbi:MAG: hypothetical protein AAGF74_04465 [Pseudomonadota bacterium]